MKYRTCSYNDTLSADYTGMDQNANTMKKLAHDFHHASRLIDATILHERLVNIAAGDKTFEATLTASIWQAYMQAGYPFGSNMKGMVVWWAFQRKTTHN